MSETPQRLGDTLVKSRLITEEQLAEALRLQMTSNLRLGEVLTGLGLVSETDVARALSTQLKIPLLSDAELRPTQDALRYVPESLARRHVLLPLRVEPDGRLFVVMADPLNVVGIDEVRFACKLEVRPAVSTARAINRAIGEAYRTASLQQPVPVGLAPEAPGRDPAQGDDAPIIRFVNDLFQQAVRLRASDVHLEPTESELRVRFRVDGMLQEVSRLPRSMHNPVTSRIKIMAAMDISERRLPQDGRFMLKQDSRDIDFRVSSLPTIFGEKLVIRVLDKSLAVTKLAQVGMLPEMLAQYLGVIRRPYGMVLVTGPTGSGKTSTLRATLNELNTPEKNIVTIEDPVEYQIPGVNHVQTNPRAGLDFANGLRSILRQDPNIIMVGEIRDRETAEIAVGAALTGHLVFSTIHTGNAVSAATRLIDMDVEPFLVASALHAVVAQRLARALCPHCKELADLPPDAPERFSLKLPPQTTQVYRAKGCEQCSFSGYHGRLAFFELLTLTPRLREMIHDKAPINELQVAAISDGMKTLVRDAVDKALQGLTTLEEVMRVALAEEG